MTPGFEPTGLPTWMGNLVVVPDASGAERMFGIYGKPNHDMSFSSRGWGIFDDESSTFKNLEHYARATYLPADELTPSGDPALVTHDDGDYLYYGTMRVPAKAESLLNIDAFETYSPYEARTRRLQYDADGSLAYSWKRQAYPATEKDLKAQGVDLRDYLDELNFQDRAGRGVASAPGNLEKNWNDYRKRFIGTIQQKFGTSFAGESWYAEADTPMGPWNFAEKVVSHDNYTFYNLQQYPFYDQENGRLVYFEGTYTAFFTNATPTPRHDYNEVMYRLRLDDERLNLPVAVYDQNGRGRLATKTDLEAKSGLVAPAFFALERPARDSKAFTWTAPDCDPTRRLVAKDNGFPAFHALPIEATASPANADLFEFINDRGQAIYSIETDRPGFTRSATALARVWKPSSRVKLPVGDYQGNLRANAGPDQCLGGSEVILDASASRAQKGRITAYEWTIVSDYGRWTLAGVRQNLNWLPGVYWIELKITGDDLDHSIDHMMVKVQGR